jgi:hypothetical protein
VRRCAWAYGQLCKLGCVGVRVLMDSFKLGCVGVRVLMDSFKSGRLVRARIECTRSSGP